MGMCGSYEWMKNLCIGDWGFLLCLVVHSEYLLNYYYLKKKKKKGFRVEYGYPWIIYSDKIRVWILIGIDIRVSKGKLFG